MYEYEDFVVSVRRGSSSRRGDRITVDAMANGVHYEPEDAHIQTDSIEQLERELASDELGRDELFRELGELHGLAMFPPSIKAIFNRTVADVTSHNRRVRIRLLCTDREMARWRWEYVRLALDGGEITRYLLQDERISLVRIPVGGEKLVDTQERSVLKIVTLDATEVIGDGLARLKPDFPERLVRDRLQHVVAPDATDAAFEEIILEVVNGEQPIDVFHFAGHGRQANGRWPGALVLSRAGSRGNVHYSADRLASQLGQAGTTLAFLNACGSDDCQPDSQSLAQSVSKQVPIVIGVRGTIPDLVAKGFASAFYDSLLAGGTVDESVYRGRFALRDSPSEWGRVVVYSRLTSGRFVIRPAPPRRRTEAARPVPDGVRRWAVLHNAQGYWRLVPAHGAPQLVPIDQLDEVDLAHLAGIEASVALSADGRVAAQFSDGQLNVAWVDRTKPGLDRWPSSFVLPELAGKGRLLAVAADSCAEALCVVSNEQVTVRVIVSPVGRPVTTVLHNSPSRCATIVAGLTATVDIDGQLREGGLTLSAHGIVSVRAIDAARAGGRSLYALLGNDHRGSPVLLTTTSVDRPVVQSAQQIDEVAVVRLTGAANMLGEVLALANGRIQTIEAGDGV
jgi:hypothetical protein